MTSDVRPAARLQEVLAAFDLERLGDDTWVGASVEFGSAVVFGGQLIGQALGAASLATHGKKAKSVHTVFSRAGSATEPVRLHVDIAHDGQMMGSAGVDAYQGDRLLSRSLVMLDAGGEDLVRYSRPAPNVPTPAESAAQPATIEGWEYRFTEDVDLDDPNAIGPAELDVWTRFAVADVSVGCSQALLAWASDGFLIGTAMRPHAGVGQSMAHRELSTAVLTHTLIFHDDFDAGGWLLLAQRCDFAGGGRAFGSADVFTEDGRLVASYVQESMIRAMPADRSTR